MRKHLRKLGAMLIAVLMLCMFSAAAFADNTDLTADESKERILNIYKFSSDDDTPPLEQPADGTENTNVATGRTPLENVEFGIYKVPERQGTSAIPTEDEISAIKLAGAAVVTVKTGSGGLATHSFGTGSANDGAYLIIEKANAAVTTPAAPFYVNMPMTESDGTGFLYEVYVYPKNVLQEAPKVSKVVEGATGNGSVGYNVGDTFSYTISGTVPADLYFLDAGNNPVYAQYYKFTDNLDYRLTYEDGLKVELFVKEGEVVTLLSGTDYEAVHTPASDPLSGTLVVSLKEAGMLKIMEEVGTDIATAKINVTFDVSINDKVSVDGKPIKNSAILDYKGSTGKEYPPVEPDPDDPDPDVHTGGLVIDKVTNYGDKLAGATFQIARAATADEIAAPGDAVKTIWPNGAGTPGIQVVFVDFYNTATFEGVAKVKEVTTNNLGEALFYGLADGTYYIVETKAPAGYNVLTAPFVAEVTIDSHNSIIEVINSAKFTLPATGGAGTVFFTMGGILLLGAAAVLIIVSRKKKPTGK